MSNILARVIKSKMSYDKRTGKVYSKPKLIGKNKRSRIKLSRKRNR